MTMTWKNGRELATLTKDGKTISYSYNADGIRTEKNNNGVITKYFYDSNNNLTSLICGDTQLLFYYDVDGQADSFIVYSGDSATRYYYVKNLQSDITKIMSANGTVVANYYYGAHGEILSITDADGEQITNTSSVAFLNPLRYRGYVYDGDTGFYYLQSRYYDATIKRFVNADIYVDAATSVIGANMFAYCDNNPITGYDPEGTYNRANAIAYALKWYNKRNTSYYSYGQDCANFVSQCLYNGGIKKTSNWYSYRKTNKYTNWTWLPNNKRYNWDVSESWRLVSEQYKYFSDISKYSKGISPAITKTSNIKTAINKFKIKSGDIMYFVKKGSTTPYHATLITKVSGGKIYFSAHTSPRKDADLSKHMGSDYVIIVRLKENA